MDDDGVFKNSNMMKEVIKKRENKFRMAEIGETFGWWHKAHKAHKAQVCLTTPHKALWGGIIPSAKWASFDHPC